jgi:hypothetical protein
MMKLHSDQMQVKRSDIAVRLRQAGLRFSAWNLAQIVSLICLCWGVFSLFSGNVDGPDHMSHSHAVLMAGSGLACLCYTIMGERAARGGTR